MEIRSRLLGVCTQGRFTRQREEQTIFPVPLGCLQACRVERNAVLPPVDFQCPLFSCLGWEKDQWQGKETLWFLITGWQL